MAQLTPQFFKTILDIERGWQGRSDDSGNWACGLLLGTKYGVSAVAYSQWVGRCPSVEEMKGLTEETAFNFYAWYFNQYNLYPIQSQKFFELLANNTMGSPAGAARAEQKALNRMGFQVAVDGVRGPQTVAALNAAWKKSPATIYNLVREEWINHLNSINLPQFLEGWMIRLNKYFPPLSSDNLGGMGIAVLVGLTLYFANKNRA